MAESMKGLKRTHRCGELSSSNIGEMVTVMGWVQKNRNKGGIVFVDLRDRSGILQIVFEGEDKSALIDKAAKLRSEFVIAVVGRVEARSGAVNENLATGEIEIRADELRILSESETPPFPIEENSKTKEELRLKYRYLDLRRPDLQKNLMMRSRIATLTRQFLSEEGFLEIETPILGKSTPEGARDYLVPSRVHPGSFYGLPQSPQLFKQLLMCSGYDRYFQIAKCFRDEDLRADRQPEFTQIDMELSFVDVDDVIDVNERLLARLFKEVLDVDVALPIPRMTWQEAMDRYGSDKPDTRFGMELVDVTEAVKDCEFVVFKGAVENGGTVRGINAKGQGGMPRKKIDKLVDFAKDFGAKGLAYIALQEDGSMKSSFAKFMTEDEMQGLVQAMSGEPGDLLLFAADQNKVVWDVLGNLRLEIARQTEILDKNEYKFVWIMEFPLLEWSEEQNRYVAMHHPFTMPMEEDLQYLDSDPGRVRAKAYDIVLSGNEIGGGSVRIFQNDVQEKMFEVLGFTKEQAHEQFGFLLDAFKYGVPPHAGLAYGLDRMVMLMAKEDSIRDVMAFPKVKDASCLMTEAPNIVDEKQLGELGLELKSAE
ncbi:aspartate--tRNA ligase [Eubacterium sp. am_0171]|uniref:Aspartate--tRNA(Asp/Asn) ligase n=1 Tax=Faecalicatena contorta TaxID=39482 RepID=A0A174J017_9FIRM|nr:MULTISPECIES: aspartate--tRNA ligase [Clostridia]MSC84637.1 aspartate--tRNA ligase [Eubacterium sp. BIOML-A1]MSD06727.1 aspartate--tRNA ligase [Eubacterium sp. BIOML-A2]RYT18302.1 aspartate--tRNA ligase [Eubacterium sp. am_0171]CUO90419.1 Aspartate--tRNA ligase [[Eubacterium] contortum] [Faecalicatena contorta]